MARFPAATAIPSRLPFTLGSCAHDPFRRLYFAPTGHIETVNSLPGDRFRSGEASHRAPAPSTVGQPCVGARSWARASSRGRCNFSIWPAKICEQKNCIDTQGRSINVSWARQFLRRSLQERRTAPEMSCPPFNRPQECEFLQNGLHRSELFPIRAGICRVARKGTRPVREPLDIFKMEKDGTYLWKGAAENFELAKSTVERLATSSPGEYMIFSQTTGKRIVVKDGLPELGTASLEQRSL
jgi:hypothetical protein